MLSNIEVLSKSLPTIDDLVPMTMAVGYKAIHEFILQKCKEQTMTFTKKFKLRGNSPQINKLKTVLKNLLNQGGDNSEGHSLLLAFLQDKFMNCFIFDNHSHRDKVINCREGITKHLDV